MPTSPLPDIAQHAFITSGLDLDTAARHLMSSRRKTPRKVENAKVYLRRVLKDGRASTPYARRLCAMMQERGVTAETQWFDLPAMTRPRNVLPMPTREAMPSPRAQAETRRANSRKQVSTGSERFRAVSGC